MTTSETKPTEAVYQYDRGQDWDVISVDWPKFQASGINDGQRIVASLMSGDPMSPRVLVYAIKFDKFGYAAKIVLTPHGPATWVLMMLYSEVVTLLRELSPIMQASMLADLVETVGSIEHRLATIEEQLGDPDDEDDFDDDEDEEEVELDD